MTPLLAAAERTRADVVQLLIQRPEITLEEKIDALELLGASYANDKDHYCLTAAYQFLYQTMELRYEVAFLSQKGERCCSSNAF